MTKQEETRAAVARRRALNAVYLARPTASEISQDALENQQTNWLAARFRLTDERARLLADLVFGGAAT